MRQSFLRHSILVVGLVAGTVVHGQERSLSPPENAFARAVARRDFSFPRDDSNHPGFKTEWWYLTGSLVTEEGERFGYQATWFRSARAPRISDRRSHLATRDLFFFHGALTDTRRRAFVFDEIASRGASTWASSRPDLLRVVVLGRFLERADAGHWRASFTVDGRRVDLVLEPTTPPLLHGVEPGLSRKGDAPGQASYYYSRPRLRTRGTIQRDVGGPALAVTGTTWFDHEFGSNQLSDDQVGWDWFSTTLDDGTDLMLYSLRQDDGSIEPASSGTLRTASGERVHLKRDDFIIEPLEEWESPRTGGRYPSRWRLRVPAHQIELDVEPVLADQELDTRGSTGVRYWEGLCRYRGRIGAQAVSGHGYVELVGYAGRFRARI